MGGEGSGRRPDPIKALLNQRVEPRTPIGATGDTAIYLPNYSGVPQHQPTINKINELIAASVPSVNYIKQMLLFGDQTDGDVTIGVGTTTLTNTVWYDDLVVDGTLSVSGFKVFANTVTINNGGIIQRSPNNGGNGSGITGAGGAQGAGLSSSEIGGSASGAAGGAAGAAGGNGSNSNPAWGGVGGRGGDGEFGSGGNPGNTTLRIRRDIMSILTQLYGNTLMSGGSGGGSGSGSALINTAGGGGGGSGGGTVFICAKTITINTGGTIRALGGNGGNSGSGTLAGVGAGGGGGCVVLVYETLVNNGTISVAGGSNGSVGVTTNATSSTAGKVVLMDLTAGTVTVT